jgi:hypothetical protein
MCVLYYNCYFRVSQPFYYNLLFYTGNYLSGEDKQTLREGLDLNPLNDLGNIAVALNRAGDIMKRWRNAVVIGVMEGNDKHFALACHPVYKVRCKLKTWETKCSNVKLTTIVGKLLCDDHRTIFRGQDTEHQQPVADGVTIHRQWNRTLCPRVLGLHSAEVCQKPTGPFNAL